MMPNQLTRSISGLFWPRSHPPHDQPGIESWQPCISRRGRPASGTRCIFMPAQEEGLAMPESPPNLAVDAVVQSLITGVRPTWATGGGASRAGLSGLRSVKPWNSRRRAGSAAHKITGFSDTDCSPSFNGFMGRRGMWAKAPVKRPGAIQRLRLRSRLREAIAREDYEEAARLRDQLRLKDIHA